MSLKVLLIDDDTDFVEINRLALEKAGYNVIYAHEGKKGMQLAWEEKPDLIVLDVMMTDDTEGFHLAKELRSRERLRDIPIIMVSGIREEMDIKWKFEPDEDFLPVTEFIDKPIAPAALVAKVNEIIKK